MRITALDEYGLRCLLAIAVKGPGAQLSIPEIAELEGISESYVGKLLSLLKKGKLINAVRGRAGGFSLAHSPEDITLLEAVTTLGGLAESVAEFLSQTTLKDIIEADDLNNKDWQEGISRTNNLLPEKKRAKQTVFKI